MRKRAEWRCKSYFFMLLFMVYGYAQEQISFKQLSVKEGLSQNSVISIAQDSIGYLWLATQNGLNKYDGQSFKSYPFDFVDITRNNYSNLGQVYIDRKGNIFIIPIDKRVFRYDVNLDKFQPIENILDASFIFQDTNKNYWIGTYENGLKKTDSTFTNLQTVIDREQLQGPIYSITTQSTNKIILTSNSKLAEVDINTNNYNLIYPEDVFGNKINQNFSKTIIDNSKTQWIGTFGDGLYYRKSTNNLLQKFFDVAFTYPFPSDLNILDLYKDKQERLWVATYGNGLYMIDFNTEEIKNFKIDKYNPKAIHYNDILCIHRDYSGTFWFGTDGAGVSFFDEHLNKFNSITNLQTPESINVDVVRAISVDSDKKIWIGTSGKGLTEYEIKTNSWRTFTTLNSKLSSNRIMSLLRDKQNNLWIGTQGGGLQLYNEKEERFKQIIKGNKTIWTIFQDSKKNIWLGTRNDGLLLMNNKKEIVKQYRLTDLGLLDNSVRVITEDNLGNLWVGTDENGIVKFSPKNEKFTVINTETTNNALVSDKIKSLYFNKNNVLWIGTNGGGLQAYDINKNKFYVFNENDGLPNNVVYAILSDTQNNLWLSSNKGITKFTPNYDALDASVIKNYNNYSGLATEFNTGAYFKTQNNNLYFGGLDGFYWFNPKELNESSMLPKTAITSLEVSGKPKTLSTNLELNHNENTINFTFSSMQFSLPKGNTYKYKLLNYDEDWVLANNNNRARYNRLPPSKYEFLVQSSNYDGVWNDTPASFTFTVKAPWYFNTYSKAFYIFLLLVAVYSTYLYFKWRWRMKLNLKLKEEEAQRLKKLNEYKSKVYTDIAHEFRTPLTLINGPIEAKLAKGSLTENEHTNFSSIKRNTNRLMSLVDQLLELAKLEKGKVKLKLIQGNLGLFLKMITESFSIKFTSKKIKYTEQIDIDNIVWYDEDTFEKIVSNLLSNALKYTPKGGKCHLEALQKENNILITIQNTAEELQDIEVEKLFDRFYQKDAHNQGAGVGLSLVSELVKLWGGSVKAKKDATTIYFKVVLPIKDAVLNKKVGTNIKNITNSAQYNSYNTENTPADTNTSNNNDVPILLVVEDNEEVRAFIKQSLYKQYKILEAKDGAEGVKLAIKHVPDIILSDIRMPNKNGIELCKTLKNDNRTDHIPIILLTADSQEENELRGLESGADDFITKPFNLRILQKRLENLVQIRESLQNRYSQEFVLKPTDISLTTTDEIFLNKLQKIIDADFSNPDFNVATFSKKMGMSRMQLHRKLLAYTGLSTSAFIRSQRLKQAVHIFKTSDATINEVAYTVGFNTPSYFIKCFKETYKKTPSEYFENTNN